MFLADGDQTFQNFIEDYLGRAYRVNLRDNGV